ncbi:MAG: flagellar hook-basal body complex protein [Planctomycetota bacterium]
MALTQTLFTGLSGIDTNQTRLNVVGNNIANVNTVGFKSSRALFKPQFYVTDASGSPPGAEFGGTNPSQRGLGATIATIQKDFSAGSIEPTGKSTDLAIEGNGFFVVEAGGDQLYSRDGSFQLNQNNELVNSSGAFVQGWAADEDGNIVRGALDKLQIPLGGATKARATETVNLKGALNTEGEIASGATILATQNVEVAGATPAPGDALTAVVPAGGGAPLFAVGDVLTLNGQKGDAALGDLTYEITGASTVGDLIEFFEQGLGIATGLPSVGAQTAGAQIEDTGAGAFGRLVVFGNQGEANEIAVSGSGFTSTNPAMSLSFAEDDAFGETTGAIGEGIRTTIPVYDSLGSALLVDVTMTLESTTGGGTTWRYNVESQNDTRYTFTDGDIDAGRFIGTGTVQFDTEGRPIGQTSVNVDVQRVNTGSGTPLSIALDFSQMSAVATESLISSQQDGVPAGTLTTFGIGDNGVITGTFSNGLNENLGQIAIAGFDNPEGLQDEGANMFRTAANSGDPQILAPTEGLAGKIRSGALELSNVDLSGEFINMIISSTGFSAASRVISTSDDLLTELINTTR